jgi:hypothetical protein
MLFGAYFYSIAAYAEKNQFYFPNPSAL